MSELARELQRRQKNQEQFAALLDGYNDLMASHQRQQSEILAQVKEYTDEFERLSTGEREVRLKLEAAEARLAESCLIISKLQDSHNLHTKKQTEIYLLMSHQNRLFKNNIANLKVLLLAAGGVGFIWFITLGVMVSLTVG